MRRGDGAIAALAAGIALAGAASAAGCAADPPPAAAAAATVDAADAASRLRRADALREARVAEGGSDAGKALAAWEEVLRVEPGNAGALYATARLLGARGDVGAALDRLARLRAVEPGAGRGLLLAAELLMDPGSGDACDPEAAVESCRVALALNPEESGPHLALGRALLRAGRRGEAAERLAVAARMNPRDAESRSLLGVVRGAAGDAAGARAAFHDALAAAAPPGTGAGAGPDGGVPGEGDTRESLAADRAPTAGALRAVAGFALLGVPVRGTDVAAGEPAAALASAVRASLESRGTGEAALDTDGDGVADAVAVSFGGRTAVAVVVPTGGVRVHVCEMQRQQ